MMKYVNAMMIIVFFLFSVSSCSEEKTEEFTPWDWDMAKIESHVNQVRAGKDLTPSRWPGDNRVAVGLSFDFDSETNALRDNNLSPGEFSRGEYSARAAIPRILELMDRYEIPASFFVPAVTAKLHQPEIRAIVDKGLHEIGMHGWIHERNSLLSEEDERELMQKSFDVLKELTGKAPAGIRTPSWDFSVATLKLIRELGLLYDSSLMADDRPYEVLEYGEATGVVELPVEWILDDYPYFGFSRYTAVRPHIKPMDVFDIWTAEFDKAHEEGSVFILTMHPKYVGHRSRILMLEKLIKYMKSKEGVWFATHADIARAAQKQIGEK